MSIGHVRGFRGDIQPHGGGHGGCPDPCGELDWAAVDRLIDGVPVDAYTCELRMAVGRLTEQGMSTYQIARRLRVSDRTVTRHRAWLHRVGVAA